MKSEKLFLNIEHNQQTSGDCSRTTREQLAWVVASWGSGKLVLVSGVGVKRGGLNERGPKLPDGVEWTGGALGGDWGVTTGGKLRLRTSLHNMKLSPQNSFGDFHTTKGAAGI